MGSSNAAEMATAELATDVAPGKPAHVTAAEADPHVGYSTAAAVEAATALGVGGIDAKTPT